MKHTLLIAGCGVSGQGAARLAAARKLDYVLLDEKDTNELREFAHSLEYPPRQCFFGWKPGTPIPQFDSVILSPGIRKTNPLYNALEASSRELIGELDFAIRLWNRPFAGITGTNGKTTTTELTARILRAHGLNADAFGNIGRSLCDAVRAADGLEFAVLEISSFQLEGISSIHPRAAALLNLASDHIDRHGGMDAYAAAKCKLLAGSELPPVLNGNLRGKISRWLPGRQDFLTFSAVLPDTDFSLAPNGDILYNGLPVLNRAELRLQGLHNLENVMAALALLTQIAGPSALRDERVHSALRSFEPAAHRMELFLEHGGIRYVDDSKATNPHAVNAAVAAYGAGQNIRILLGGLDKNMDFSELLTSAGHIAHAYLFGACRAQIQTALADSIPCTDCGTFANAVSAACSAAKTGDVVLLSPATASMDEFRNYKERGLAFQRLVHAYCGV